MRVLVGIPNFGTKNRRFLDRVIEGLLEIPHDVHVVVSSEVERDYGGDVENIVGLPTPDPRSLPFAHRTLFADRIDRHDLFVYVEDDTLVEARHVDMFLASVERLPRDELAGFLRQEKYDEVRGSISTVHWSYRWDPVSLRVHGGQRYAHFTNLHAACYMLTRDQLGECVASGGYLVAPHEGRYQMLESAATDPYSQCGFRKMIALDRLDDTILHHLPELYLGRLGERRERFMVGVDALRPGIESASTLDPATSLDTSAWDLDLYLRLPGAAVDLVDGLHRRVLTVGGAGGRAEGQMLDRGAAIASIPVDAVLGRQLVVEGVEVARPGIEEGFADLAGRRFDLVMFVDTLAFLTDPQRALELAKGVLDPDGRVVVIHRSGAFEALRDTLRDRRLRRPAAWSPRDHGRWPAPARWLRAGLGAAGLRDVDIRATGEGDVASSAERLVPRRLEPLLLPMLVASGRP
ncbi:MAG: hypothetical protein ACE5GB_00255 [Acidimicrobiales bacterium]